MSGDGFDRLRPRTPEGAARPTGREPADPAGRRALYSVAEQPATFGAVTVDCSSCGGTSVVTPRSVLGLLLPSVHLPWLRRGHGSWMRCPACRRRTWVGLGLRL